MRSGRQRFDMTTHLCTSRRITQLLATGAGLTVGAWAAVAGTAWLRYGHATGGRAEERDELLDRFIPVYDVVERHHIRVAAPAAVTLAAAKEQDFQQIPAIRAIFKTREMVLRSTPLPTADTTLFAQVQQFGWGVLAERPGREVVLGAVTRPWEANPVFRALPPSEFAAFNEPGFVKIAWTLRADPTGDRESVFRTETRAVATDASARTRFRRYWAFVSPGVAAIRRLSLRPLKREAERRAA
jgi:hypothetical protein